MDPALFILLVCLGLGAVVGLFAGLLGIGGGLIIVPSLLYLLTEHVHLPLKVAMPMAIATSLSTIVLTAISSSRAHYKLGNLRQFYLLWTGLGISVGAIIGPQFATMIPAESLKTLFAILVLVIAAQMILLGNKSAKRDVSKEILLLIGVITGCISSVMGIGGGAIMVPALLWCRVDIRIAIGCAAFSGLVIALFGSASFIVAGWDNEHLPQWAVGFIYLPATLGIVCTSVFTAGVGAKLSRSLNTQLLKKIFAGFLVIVSLRMLLG
ncbi:sulfite exporter TauE/SafE family protein [Paraglaciecola sp. 20A4]|uniref:sulfite exporter TauE/SafE family protein n=1 Tax=Paraglaciecola sp. 20A4 TaxID=2687288 RepID=UPI00140D4231|nr:sulfite exporter TauE/SafE family protein [Paraglaciecola sp. 20A4]